MDEFVQFWKNLWNDIVKFFTFTPENGLSNINKFFIALSILIVGLLLVKIIFSLLNKTFKVKDISTNSSRKTVLRFVLKALKTICVFFIILFAASTLGLKMDGLATVISSGILAIGVSLQDVIGNFAAGIIILSSRLFVEGDYIEVNDTVKGTVKEIKMMSTQLTTPDNISLVVPNSVMTKGNVHNYNKEEIRRVDLTVGVDYRTDLEACKKVLMYVLLNDDRILKTQPITVAVKELNSSSIDFAVRGYVKNYNYWDTKFALNEKIAMELAKRNINIPFNQLDVNLFNNGLQETRKVDLTGIPKDVLNYTPLPVENNEETDLDKVINAAKKKFKGRKKKAKKAEEKKAEEEVKEEPVPIMEHVIVNDEKKPEEEK